MYCLVPPSASLPDLPPATSAVVLGACWKYARRAPQTQHVNNWATSLPPLVRALPRALLHDQTEIHVSLASPARQWFPREPPAAVQSTIVPN